MATRRFLLFALLLILTLGMKVQCKRKPNLRDPKVANNILNKCAKGMQLKFPASARLLNFAQARGKDYAVCLKVEIDRNDLQYLIDNSLFAGKELVNRRSVGEPGPADWWDPDSARDFRSGAVRLQPGDWESLAILINLDTPGKAIIYFEYMGSPIL
jgi:hypothetical protein